MVFAPFSRISRSHLGGPVSGRDGVHPSVCLSPLQHHTPLVTFTLLKSEIQSMCFLELYSSFPQLLGYFDPFAFLDSLRNSLPASEQNPVGTLIGCALSL